jgi:hypothetical protein
MVKSYTFGVPECLNEEMGKKILFWTAKIC